MNPHFQWFRYMTSFHKDVHQFWREKSRMDFKLFFFCFKGDLFLFWLRWYKWCFCCDDTNRIFCLYVYVIFRRYIAFPCATSLPYTRRQQENTEFRNSCWVCYTTIPQWSPFNVHSCMTIPQWSPFNVHSCTVYLQN